MVDVGEIISPPDQPKPNALLPGNDLPSTEGTKAGDPLPRVDKNLLCIYVLI